MNKTQQSLPINPRRHAKKEIAFANTGSHLRKAMGWGGQNREFLGREGTGKRRNCGERDGSCWQWHLSLSFPQSLSISASKMAGAYLRRPIGVTEIYPKVREQKVNLRVPPGMTPPPDAAHTLLVQLHWWEELSQDWAVKGGQEV